MDIKYLFIDGGYFRKVLENISSEFFDGSLLPFSYSNLTAGYSFTKVFYYDCLAPPKPEEPRADYEQRVAQQIAHFRKLSLLSGWHVVQGVVKGQGKRARQKEIDIQIAVDMLTHSQRRNMNRISFIAGDQDFKPLVDAVVREGMFIELWYERESASEDLALAADSRMLLDVFLVHSLLDPKFQQRFPLPNRSSQPGKGVDGGVLLESAQHGEEQLELFQLGDQHLIVQPNQWNVGYYDRMSHSDINYLKKVHASVHGNAAWSKIA